MIFLKRITLGCSLLVVLSVVIAGCQSNQEETIPDSTAAQSSGTNDQQNMDSERRSSSDDRKAVAVQAKDALFAKLSGRLMEVLQSEGPAQAISVCSQEAVKIADDVGKENGVQIGRTSFKLRNSANAPRDWVKPFVEERVQTPQFVQLDGGSLGGLFPIHLNVKCLMCHGGEDEILDDVKLELAKQYPDDQAIGFKQGELRGWFWVEVPPTN